MTGGNIRLETENVSFFLSCGMADKPCAVVFLFKSSSDRILHGSAMCMLSKHLAEWWF